MCASKPLPTAISKPELALACVGFGGDGGGWGSAFALGIGGEAQTRVRGGGGGGMDGGCCTRRARSKVAVEVFTPTSFRFAGHPSPASKLKSPLRAAVV